MSSTSQQASLPSSVVESPLVEPLSNRGGKARTGSGDVSSMIASNGILGDVYQRIWTSDVKSSSGVRAILSSEEKNKSEGYVIVNESIRSSTPGELFPGEPVIPPSKQRSYDLARALFDNYNFLASVREEVDPEEIAEIDELLDYIVASAPMSVAREYIAETSGRLYSDRSWFAHLKELWFRPFRSGSSPSRSGFEHVFLGEKKGSKVGGLHWWYFYAKKENEIKYGGVSYGNVERGDAVPDIATMAFTWTVDGNTIFKKKGGFFVGPSVEGLMAMGTVRAAADTPSKCVIEGLEIDLKMFKSEDKRSINTFYPVLRRVITKGSTAPKPIPTVKPTVSSGAHLLTIRLVGAFTNPSGVDAGRESVTLMNVRGPKTADISGWTLIGPRGGEVQFAGVKIEPGRAETFVLSARSGVALSNKGGSISLRAPNGTVVQTLDYPSNVQQGQALIWDGSSRLIPVPT